MILRGRPGRGRSSWLCHRRPSADHCFPFSGFRFQPTEDGRFKVRGSRVTPATASPISPAAEPSRQGTLYEVLGDPATVVTGLDGDWLLEREEELEDIAITDRGRTFASQAATTSLDLSQSQAQLLLAALLDQAAIEQAAALLVSNFQLVRGALVARKNSIQPGTTQLLLCRLLQQLGAISVSGDYYIIFRPFENLLAHLVIRTAKLTQAELLQRLERQRVRGELAEQKVLAIEKDRLTALKRPDMAAKVERISIDDVSAGYDIKSFEKNECPRRIEVKSSVGSQITFEWSAGERATAAKQGDCYCVYFVPFSFTLPDLAAPVVILRNPTELIRSGCLVETPRSFLVTEVPVPIDTARRTPPRPADSPVTYVYK